jgi:hypothetical protein
VGGQPVEGTTYVWHTNTDGQATFPTVGPDGRPDGGYILTANSEVPSRSGPLTGGVSAIEFDRDGKVEAARRILSGTSANCAGGPTPWGTWLSCEETDDGLVHECDPTGVRPAVKLPALGTFKHEAVCVDSVEERLYLTEDQGTGLFYRFTPTNYPSLDAGVLEAAVVSDDGAVTWARVPRPNEVTPTPTRRQVPGARTFSGGEGIWYDSGVVYFTAKGEKRVYALDVAAQRLEVVYDPKFAGDGSPLRAVDNVTVARSGQVFVCEDGDNFEIVLITPDRQVASFVQLDPSPTSPHVPPSDQVGNETVGVVFDPSGQRMFFGVQRSFGGRGAVYEVTGPFSPSSDARLVGGAAPGPAQATPDGPRQDGDEGDENASAPSSGAGAGAGGGAGAAAGGSGAPASGPGAEFDRVAPGIRLAVSRRLRLSTFSRRGVRVTLEVDEPSGVKAYLRVGGVTVRDAPTVAVRGRVAFLLRPDDAAVRRLARRRRPLRAQLTLDVRDASGNRRVIRRTVLVKPRAKPARRRGRQAR